MHRNDSARAIFDRQRAAWLTDPYLPLAERRRALATLEHLIVDHQEEIAEAVCRDFGHRSRHETKFLESGSSLFHMGNLKSSLPPMR